MRSSASSGVSIGISVNSASPSFSTDPTESLASVSTTESSVAVSLTKS